MNAREQMIVQATQTAIIMRAATLAHARLIILEMESGVNLHVL
jgi:hypothetical protein